MLYFRWIIFLGLTILSIIGIMPTYDYYSNYFGKDNFENLQSQLTNSMSQMSNEKNEILVMTDDNFTLH